jgi:GMP synthase-like glutamine amidotransferase
MNQFTVGILVTNTDTSNFAKGWPRDGEKFTRLINAVRPHWVCRVFDCTVGEFPSQLDSCDGYIIGGSPASVNDDAPWISKLLTLIQALDNARTPTIGCCFGHQAIAKALGGKVGKNPGGWGFGVSPTEFSVQKNWMQPPAQTMLLYAAHSEQVTFVPPTATVIGGDSFCPAASLLVGEHFLTTEYHPEMSQEFFMALTWAFESYIGSDVAQQARKQAEEPTQGAQFAEWMARFLEMPRQKG